MHSSNVLSYVGVCSFFLPFCHGLIIPTTVTELGVPFSTGYAPGSIPTSASTVGPNGAANVVAGAAIPLPSDYISTVLFQHNVHRANHSAGALEYNQTLACEAVANMMPTYCTFDHGDPGNYYGIATTLSTSNAAGFTASGVFAWYNEEPAYAAATQGYTIAPDGSSFDSWGHFTQMIWASATQVGCWAVECDSSTSIVQQWPGLPQGPGSTVWQVGCKYSPAGNNGQYTENVFPPTGQPPINDQLPYWNNAPNGDAC